MKWLMIKTEELSEAELAEKMEEYDIFLPLDESEREICEMVLSLIE